MNFVKIETSDNETRWINLDHISRVTLATQTGGMPLLVIFFADGNRDCSWKIDGSDPINKKAIDHFVAHLNSVE